jgi:hypothetical protein
VYKELGVELKATTTTTKNPKVFLNRLHFSVNMRKSSNPS